MKSWAIAIKYYDGPTDTWNSVGDTAWDAIINFHVRYIELKHHPLDWKTVQKFRIVPDMVDV